MMLEPLKARRAAVAFKHSLCSRLIPSMALEQKNPFVPAYLPVCFSVPVENELLDKSTAVCLVKETSKADPER